MAKITCFSSVKGGAGKTTLSHGVAHEAARQGNRVLVVDIDLQGNISSYLTGREYPANWFDRSIVDVLDPSVPGRERAHPKEVIVPSKRDGIDVLPAGEMVDMDTMTRLLTTANGKEFYLTRALEKVSDDYDLIIIDAPPGVNIITANVHLASTAGVVLVANPAHGDIQGMVKLVATVQGYNDKEDAIAALLPAPIEIAGLVIDRMDIRSKSKAAARDQLVAFAEQLDIPVLGVPIPDWNFIAEATAVGMGLDETGDSRASFVTSQFAEIVNALMSKEG